MLPPGIKGLALFNCCDLGRQQTVNDIKTENFGHKNTGFMIDEIVHLLKTNGLLCSTLRVAFANTSYNFVIPKVQEFGLCDPTSL